jgi:hypothetical protein
MVIPHRSSPHRPRGKIAYQVAEVPVTAIKPKGIKHFTQFVAQIRSNLNSMETSSFRVLKRVTWTFGKSSGGVNFSLRRQGGFIEIIIRTRVGFNAHKR